MSETASERLRKNAVQVTSILVTGVWMAAMFTGQEWWLAALIVGYVAVVPLAKIAFGRDEEAEYEADDEDGDWSHWWGREKRSKPSREADGDDETPLKTLRERYARGELTDEQFERKLERLLETETIEDAADWRRAERELEYER